MIFILRLFISDYRKAVNNAYEEYVLSVGDFDERIFLDDDAEEEIGTPGRLRDDVTGELAERMQQRTSLQQHVNQVFMILILGRMVPCTR